MDGSSKAPASVLAAAVLSILCAIFFLLGGVAGLLGFLLSNALALPKVVRTMEIVIMGLMIGVSVLGLVTGVGLIRLRNWARISVLIWAGFFVFFAAVGIPFALILPKIAPNNAPQLPQSSQQLFEAILLFTYGLPLVIGLWWLILFNRKSIKARFNEASASASTVLQKPRCPVPVTVLAWFYVAAILNLAFLPLIPLRFPVYVFGLALPEKAGLPVLLITVLAFFVGGLGLLKLKRWSYSMTTGLQTFWLLSGIVSMLNLHYDYGAALIAYTKEVDLWMGLPETQFPYDYFARQFKWVILFGLAMGSALLGVLVHYRRRFLEAASAARSNIGLVRYL